MSLTCKETDGLSFIDTVQEQTGGLSFIDTRKNHDLVVIIAMVTIHHVDIEEFFLPGCINL